MDEIYFLFQNIYISSFKSLNWLQNLHLMSSPKWVKEFRHYENS